MRSGEQIFSDFEKIIKAFDEKELEMSVDTHLKVVNDALKKTLDTEKKHIKCIGPLEHGNFVHTDRLKNKSLARGCGSLESFWGFLNRRFPQICSPSFGMSLLLLLLAN